MLHRSRSIHTPIIWLSIIYLTCTRAGCWVTSQRIDVDEKPVVGPKVFLTVNALASHTANGTVSERLLELNWDDGSTGMNADPTSWVGLFSHDPEENSSDPLEVAPTKSYNGYYKTRIQFPRFEFYDMEKIQDGCLGYWIGYVNLNKLVSKSCIRSQPNWMKNLQSTIGNKTLMEIMLPGTHNAGSYEPYKPERNTAKIRYQICHDENIFNQLVYGNRFIDLRVIYQHVAGNKEKFWITHGLLRTNNTVREVLLQVKRFLDLTNEVVIMDFHLFYMGFIDSWVDRRHDELIKMIVSVLGHHMMPISFEYQKSLNKIWDSNKRLLVGYAAKQRHESNLLFPGAFHLWGNKETVVEMEEFLERNMCSYRHRNIWSAMTELTPTTSGVLIDKYGGLRKMAQDINLVATKWFRNREWWKCANVVSTDFFLGNDFINLSIEANLRRHGA